ncbi:MAG TPA: class I SAM-dependent methyltransferase [bacterium]|nr:class I SAM-dependent methyltransferase [bacterium]
MAGSFGFYDRLYIHFFYRLRSWKYDLPENKAGWRSRRNQELRFQALMAIGDLQNKSILDLGCGLGCLYGYLKGTGWKGEYTGFDILDFMVKGARARFPGARFEQRDILKDPPREKWDYVFVNGVFNHKIKDNWAWIGRMVGQAFSCTREGMAFTMLNRETGWPDEGLFYTTPRELEEKIKRWSPGKYKIAMGYLPEDMAAYLYH